MNTQYETQSTALQLLPHPATSSSALMLDSANMDSMIRVAEMMASGRSTVPVHLQKNPSDCMAVVMQAIQWRMNPFVVAQKTHVVNGSLGYEAQLVNAVITTMAPTKDRLHFDWFGDWKRIDGKTNKSDEIGVKVWATLKGENSPRELEVTMAQAGVRNSPLWVQDPRLQLAYLAIKRWARLYTPDVILGVYTPDEFSTPPERHMGPAEVVAPASYPQADFDKNLPAWAKVIASGRKTLDALAAMVGSKAPLTDAQKQALQEAADKLQANTVDAAPAVTPAPAQPASEPEPAPAAGPAITFAQVNTRLAAAKDLDALSDAASLIGEVSDPQHRKELSEIYSAREQEINP